MKNGMNPENMKNIIILKNLPSNLIDEAIVVVKNKKESKDINYKTLMQDGKSRAIHGYMKEEELKKIENIKKEERNYIIKEAEMVVANYIAKIENQILAEKKVKKIEKLYKKVRILNVMLAIISLICVAIQIIK